MDFKLAVSLLVIGILGVVIFVWYGIRWLITPKIYNRMLKKDILNNIGIDISGLTLENKNSHFVVAKKANNAGPNHCDIIFKSDLRTLSERTYSRDFISTPAKD